MSNILELTNALETTRLPSDDVAGIIEETRKYVDYQYITGSEVVRGFAFPPTSPAVWVKWGRNDNDEMRTEYHMQQYVAVNLANTPDAETRNVGAPEPALLHHHQYQGRGRKPSPNPRSGSPINGCIRRPKLRGRLHVPR